MPSSKNASTYREEVLPTNQSAALQYPMMSVEIEKSTGEQQQPSVRFQEDLIKYDGKEGKNSGGEDKDDEPEHTQSVFGNDISD